MHDHGSVRQTDSGANTMHHHNALHTVVVEQLEEVPQRRVSRLSRSERLRGAVAVDTGTAGQLDPDVTLQQPRNKQHDGNDPNDESKAGEGPRQTQVTSGHRDPPSSRRCCSDASVSAASCATCASVYATRTVMPHLQHPHQPIQLHIPSGTSARQNPLHDPRTQPGEHGHLLNMPNSAARLMPAAPKHPRREITSSAIFKGPPTAAIGSSEQQVRRRHKLSALVLHIEQTELIHGHTFSSTRESSRLAGAAASPPGAS